MAEQTAKEKAKAEAAAIDKAAKEIEEKEKRDEGLAKKKTRDDELAKKKTKDDELAKKKVAEETINEFPKTVYIATAGWCPALNNGIEMGHRKINNQTEYDAVKHLIGELFIPKKEVE